MSKESHKSKNKVKGIILSILPFAYALLIQIMVTLVGSIVYGMVLGIQLALEGISPEEIAILSSEKVQSGNFLLGISGISALVWIVIYGIWYRRSYVKERKVETKKVFSLKSLIWLTLLGIGLQFSVTMILNFILSLNLEFIKSYEDVMNTLGMGNSLISFVYIVLIAPVAEELIFRGVIFEKSKRVLPLVYANILQALLFGLMHFNIVQSSYAFILGLFLGFVCYKRKSILASIYLHFVINLAGVLPNILFSNESESQSALNVPIAILVAVISTVIVVVSTIKINKDKRDNDEIVYDSQEIKEETDKYNE
jgi:membrane protease YdiL (CAAX protease family)